MRNVLLFMATAERRSPRRFGLPYHTMFSLYDVFERREDGGHRGLQAVADRADLCGLATDRVEDVTKPGDVVETHHLRPLGWECGVQKVALCVGHGDHECGAPNQLSVRGLRAVMLER